MYSCTMWMATIIKSFTERNFLVPFITHALNPEIANIFKLSNDMALVFYRFILKTIGTADTSLLSQSSLFGNNVAFNAAFTKLITKIAHLCLFAFVIIMAINMYRIYFFDTKTIGQLFLITAICYIIEALLLPFERILEIKENYLYLFIGYIPYIVILILILFASNIPTLSSSFISFIILVHIARLASSFLITIFAHKKHNNLTFFTSFVTKRKILMQQPVKSHITNCSKN